MAGLGKRAFRQPPTHAPWTQTRLLGDGSGRHAKVLPCHDLLIERKAAFPTSLLNALDDGSPIGRPRSHERSGRFCVWENKHFLIGWSWLCFFHCCRSERLGGVPQLSLIVLKDQSERFSQVVDEMPAITT